MFCTKCGKQLPDGLKFCTGCGKPVSRAPQVNNPNNNYPHRYTAQNINPKPQNSSKGLIIAIIAIAAVLVLGLIVFFVVNGFNGTTMTGTPATGSVPESSAPIKESTTPISSEVPSTSIAIESSVQDDEPREYILEHSSSRIILDSELEKLNAQELRIARNEIYARHGRKFKDEDLQNYFNSKSWYHGTIEPDKFNDNSLSDIEMKNRDLIQKYENMKR